MKPWTHWRWVNRLVKRTETWNAINAHARREADQADKLSERVKELEAVERVLLQYDLHRTYVSRDYKTYYISVTESISEQLFFESRLYGGDPKMFEWLAHHIAANITRQFQNGFVIPREGPNAP